MINEKQNCQQSKLTDSCSYTTTIKGNTWNSTTWQTTIPTTTDITINKHTLNNDNIHVQSPPNIKFQLGKILESIIHDLKTQEPQTPCTTCVQQKLKEAKGREVISPWWELMKVDEYEREKKFKQEKEMILDIMISLIGSFIHDTKFESKCLIKKLEFLENIKKKC